MMTRILLDFLTYGYISFGEYMYHLSEQIYNFLGFW